MGMYTSEHSVRANCGSREPYREHTRSVRAVKRRLGDGGGWPVPHSRRYARRRYVTRRVTVLGIVLRCRLAFPRRKDIVRCGVRGVCIGPRAQHGLGLIWSDPWRSGDLTAHERFVALFPGSHNATELLDTEILRGAVGSGVLFRFRSVSVSCCIAAQLWFCTGGGVLFVRAQLDAGLPCVMFRYR